MKHSCGFSGFIVCASVLAITSGCAPGSIADRERRGDAEQAPTVVADGGPGLDVSVEDGEGQVESLALGDAGGKAGQGAGPDGGSGGGGSDGHGQPGSVDATSRPGGQGGTGSDGSGGSSGAVGLGGGAGTGGSTGTDVGRSDGGIDPSDASTPNDGPNGTSMAVNAWSGKWAGEFRFTVDAIKDPLNDLQWLGRSWGLAMGVDEFAIDEAAEGWASVTGRLASSDCLLTGALNAMVFFGDSISFVSAPLFTGSGGGVDRNGQPVAVTLAGERHGDTIVGKISFESQNPLAPFCDHRQLEFSLFRTR
jgi:hypothetical protein